MKNQLLTMLSNFKPHFDFLIAETEGLSLVQEHLCTTCCWVTRISKTIHEGNDKIKLHIFLINVFIIITFAIHVTNIISLFWQESYKSVQPYIIQIALVTKIYLGKVLVRLGKISMLFLTELVERLNDFLNQPS